MPHLEEFVRTCGHVGETRCDFWGCRRDSSGFLWTSWGFVEMCEDEQPQKSLRIPTTCSEIPGTKRIKWNMLPPVSKLRRLKNKQAESKFFEATHQIVDIPTNPQKFHRHPNKSPQNRGNLYDIPTSPHESQGHFKICPTKTQKVEQGLNEAISGPYTYISNNIQFHRCALELGQSCSSVRTPNL